MSKFIAASRQATKLDKMRILLETRIHEIKDESKKWVEVAAKAKDDAKELQNLVEELKTNAIEKDTRLDHLQKRNDKLSALLEKAMGDAVAEFKHPNNILICWTLTMQQALKILGWKLWKTSLKLTLAPSNSILVELLQAPSYR